MLREAQAKLIDNPHLTKIDPLNDIARPITHNMKLLKQSLLDILEEYIPLRRSLILTVIVFFGNLLLHALVMYLYHLISTSSCTYKVVIGLAISFNGSILVRCGLSISFALALRNIFTPSSVFDS